MENQEAVCKEENDSDEGYKEISLDEPVKLESDDIQILLTENDQDSVQTPENPTDAEEGGFHIDNFGDEAPIVVEEPPADDSRPIKPKKERPGRNNSRGFALGSVSDKIVPWLLSRFEIKKFGKTAIQEVITLYSHDFPKDSIYFPLESFQVGQLVRQAFPDIELCKVTHKESKKRYRCYKNLYRKGQGQIFIFSNKSN